MTSKSKSNKLAAARAAAALPLHLTVAEFALLKLRQSFVRGQVTRCARSVSCVAGADSTSQSLVSASLAELFKKKYGLASCGAQPDWFVKLKESAGRSMQDFIKDEHGPWDMCVITP